MAGSSNMRLWTAARVPAARLNITPTIAGGPARFYTPGRTTFNPYCLVTLSRTGVALLLVEQYLNRALKVADQVYLLGRGAISFSGAPSELDEAELMRRYVGGGELGASIV